MPHRRVHNHTETVHACHRIPSEYLSAIRPGRHSRQDRRQRDCRAHIIRLWSDLWPLLTTSGP
eukprot:2973556-Pyramimonas_sp.AAC.1